MKHLGLIFLFCLFGPVVQAQKPDALLHVVDSLVAQPEKAIQILNEALADDPDSEELLKVRAEAYENLKLYDKAAEDYERLAHLLPDEETFWYLLGRNRYKGGKYPEALKSLDHATKLNSKYLPAFHVKINVLLQLNRNEEALKISDSTLMVGETAMNYFLQGEVYKQLNSRQKAEWAYNKATKIDKGFIEAYIALSDISADMNKAMEALSAADAALGINPDSKEALIARSRGFALMKNYADAIEDVSYVIRLDPSNTDAHFWRGMYYKDTNKLPEAIKDFDDVLSVRPTDPQALAGRAECRAKTGDKKSALADYQKLLAEAPNHPESEAMAQLAKQQIFELNREQHVPELVLLDPHLLDFDIQIPDNSKTINIKGKITDESPIKTLFVNGESVSIKDNGGDYEFSATVKSTDTLQQIRIEISDVYDNVNKLTYRLVKNETVKPLITLFTPKPTENGIITLAPDDGTTLYIEGKAVDESTISSIVVDGKAVDFNSDSSEPVFSAIIDIANKTSFSITVTDYFGNSTEKTYTLENTATQTTGKETLNHPASPPAVEQASQ